jgi:hypothetical protein
MIKIIFDGETYEFRDHGEIHDELGILTREIADAKKNVKLTQLLINYQRILKKHL